MRCYKTGRKCDGYGKTPFAVNIEAASHNSLREPNSAETGDSYHNYTTIIHNLAPFMILPATESAQAEAMSFFEYTAINHLNEHHPCESWRKTLMFYSQTVPSVRHAALALALVHRNYLDRGFGGRVHLQQLSKDAPLFHYNRAIQLLLKQETPDGAEAMAITLLVCYLFVCFDHLAGNYVQATKHLRGDVELSRGVGRTTPSLEVETLMHQVTRQIRRLDMQAVTFLIDWTPADIEETLVSTADNGVFQSLDHAADRLEVLLSQVMRLRYAMEQKTSPPASSLTIKVLLEQLNNWLHLFEAMLLSQQPSTYHSAIPERPRISLLRLQHTIIWILLSASSMPGKEMAYDNFAPQFRQCVAHAREVAAAHERCFEKPTFTPEVGIVPVLYIIGVKCRDTTVRRVVLEMLRRQTIREAVWDSKTAARVVERVIELEEMGMTEARIEQIPVWQRVEGMSWIQNLSEGGVGKVDITYTLCEQEEVFAESLAI